VRVSSQSRFCVLLSRRDPTSTLFPYTTLFRSQSQSRISIGRGNVTKSRGIISRCCIAIIICHGVTSRRQDLTSSGKGIIASSTRVASGIALAYIYSFKTYVALITRVSTYQTVASAFAFSQGFQPGDDDTCGGDY